MVFDALRLRAGSVIALSGTGSWSIASCSCSKPRCGWRLGEMSVSRLRHGGSEVFFLRLCRVQSLNNNIQERSRLSLRPAVRSVSDSSHTARHGELARRDVEFRLCVVLQVVSIITYGHSA